MVVASDVDRLSLGRDQLLVDLRLVLLEPFGDVAEFCLELRVLRLPGECFCPVHREVEVAAAVVDLADLPRGGFVVVEKLPDRIVEGLCENPGLVVVEGSGEVLERRRQRGELTERVPAEVAFLDELLNVLRSGASCSGLEQSASGEEGNDREHLRAGSDLENGEEVGQIVAKDVAGDRDGVEPSANPAERVPHGLHRRHDLDDQTIRVVILEVEQNLLDDVDVVSPVAVEPEHGRRTSGPRAMDRELDPVAYGDVGRPRHPPDVTGLDLVLHQDVAVRADDAYETVERNLESGRMRAVLFGLLGHESDIGHRSHRRRIEGTVLLAVLDDLGVHRRVAAIRDDRFRILKLPLGIPHPSGVAHDDGHGRIDDDVVGRMQVGDSLVGVDHRQRRPFIVGRANVLLDRRPRLLRERLNLLVQISQTHVRIDSGLLEGGRVLLEDVLEKHRDRVSEQDRIGHLHHGCLEMDREKLIVLPGVLDLFLVELPERLHAHVGAVENLSRCCREPVLERLGLVARSQQLDRERSAVLHHDRLLVAVEVIAVHVGHFGFRLGRPGTELVRMCLREILHRDRCPPVGIALTEDGVDRTPQHLRVASLDLLLGVVGRCLGIVGDVVTLGLELGDRFLELRNRCADVGQLDDVGLFAAGELAEPRQFVGDLLVFRQIVGKVGEDPARQRDVTLGHGDARSLRERLHDGEEGVGGQCRCFIDFRPDDRLVGHSCSLIPHSWVGERSDSGGVRDSIMSMVSNVLTVTEAVPSRLASACDGRPRVCTWRILNRAGGRHRTVCVTDDRDQAHRRDARGPRSPA